MKIVIQILKSLTVDQVIFFFISFSFFFFYIYVAYIFVINSKLYAHNNKET